MNFRFRQAGDRYALDLFTQEKGLLKSRLTVCRQKCCRPTGSFCTQFWSYLAQNHKGLCWVRLNVKM